MTAQQTMAHCKKLLTTGVAPNDFYLDESAPDHRVTLQAEVMNSPRFIDMRYALHTGVGMRDAYAMPSSFPWCPRKPVNGLMHHSWAAPAVAILRHYLDAASWDNLETILQEYRDSVVELSAYDCPVGVLGWNTLTWEVRSY